MDALRGRWCADCAAVTCTGTSAVATDVVTEVGNDLVRRWRQPHRRYHGVIHLREVLSAVDTLCAEEGVDGRSHSVATMAAWFHDAVYDVRPDATNEADSAELADRQLSRLGVDPELVARVVAAVIDTASHELPPDAGGDPATLVLHDADLWVLSAPVARFDEYCAQVREERNSKKPVPPRLMRRYTMARAMPYCVPTLASGGNPDRLNRPPSSNSSCGETTWSSSADPPSIDHTML